MTTRLKPADLDQLRDAVAWVVAEEKPAEIVCHGTKQDFGRTTNSEVTLDMSGLAGIVSYEPDELVLTAKAGTPMSEITEILAAEKQALAFEPPSYGPMLGHDAGGSLGGSIACNLSGPRRFKVGAARDHFLGVSAVNGRGEIFKSGGRVVKNVTGYDLCKLLAGSYGTLAVMAEITVKVLPQPEKTRTVLISGLDDATAVRLLGDIASGRHEASGLAHLPENSVARSQVSYLRGAGRAVTAIRLEGPAPSVLARCAALKNSCAPHGAIEELHGHNSSQLWREVGEARLLTESAADCIWRISLPPAAAAGVVAACRTGSDIVGCAYDWAGGLVWLATAPHGDGGAAVIRAALARDGGHATLIRAPVAMRNAVAVFQPQDGVLAALSTRVKKQFDPRAVLNRGRMYAGL